MSTKKAQPVEEPVVMEEDFYQLVADVLASQRAVHELSGLLSRRSLDGSTVPATLGIGTLLEGVVFRLDAALDMVVQMGESLQFGRTMNAAGRGNG